MQKNVDNSSDLQMANWNKLKKKIIFLINNVNGVNIGTVRKQLLKLNILRGRGVFCQFIMQVQLKNAIHYTHVYATLVASINLEFPSVGELMLKKYLMAFKIGHDQGEKSQCQSSALFISHLVNHDVAVETVAVECIQYLVKLPTVESIEIALDIIYCCGKKVSEAVSSSTMKALYDDMMELFFTTIKLDQQSLRQLIRLHKAENLGFNKPCHSGYMPEAFQIGHYFALDDTLNVENDMNEYYQFDPNYEDNETSYKLAAKVFLESDSEDEIGYNELKEI